MVQRVAEMDVKLYRMFKGDRILIGVAQMGKGRVLHYVCFPDGGRSLRRMIMYIEAVCNTARTESITRGLRPTVACST